MTEWTNRQKEIINAALEIISTMGIQNLTIKTLSRWINVTEGAIYRHFKSKEEILTSIAGFFKASSTELLNRIVSSGEPGINKIKAFFLGRCRQFSENRGLVLVMFSEDIFKGNEAYQKKIYETIHSHKKLLVEAIVQGQKEGIIEEIEPEHLFMAVMGALRLLVTRWRGADFDFDLLKEGEKLWKSLEKLISRKKEENREKTNH
jgi:AcrR family transcriptional regulator